MPEPTIIRIELNSHDFSKIREQTPCKDGYINPIFGLPIIVSDLISKGTALLVYKDGSFKIVNIGDIK